MWANAIAPGGTVATFIESFFEPTFAAASPALYWIPFHARQIALARRT
jgi:hypothetical protein